VASTEPTSTCTWTRSRRSSRAATCCRSPILALLVAQATRALPQKWRPAGAGAVLAGLVVFQLACLGLILHRYYDV